MEMILPKPPRHNKTPDECIMQNVLSSLALVMLAAPLSATDSTQAGMESFEKVRPILEQHCYRCHSTAAKKQRGGLLLDSRDGLHKGGESGPAIVPGNSVWITNA